MFSKLIKYTKDQKGVALISALGLTLILFVAALGIIYRLTNFTQILGSQSQKTQTYYTSSTGVEELRDYLWRNNCIPPNWCGRLGEDLTDTAQPEYSDITCEVGLNQLGKCSADPQETANNPASMDIVINEGQSNEVTFPYTYTLHLRDNADEANYAFDSDEVVTAISTAIGRDETRTTIEAMIIYTGGDCVYKQQGQCANRRSSTVESGVNVGIADPLRQTF